MYKIILENSCALYLSYLSGFLFFFTFFFFASLFFRIFRSFLNESIVGRRDFSEEDVFTRGVWKSLNIVDDVMDNGPTVLQVQVDLVSKRLSRHSLCSHDVVTLSITSRFVDALYKTKAHLLDASQKRLDSPLAEFILVIWDLTSQADSLLLIKILRPSLSLTVPFVESEQVHVLLTGFVETMNRTSHTNTFRPGSFSFPKFVDISYSWDHLRLNFNVRVFLLHGLRSAFHLSSDDERLINAGGFGHELACSVDSFLISRLEISLCSFWDSLPVQDVFLLTLVDENEVAELFDD